MANLPLMDTMHHVLKAWRIFYWFHFDSQGRWGQQGQNVECSPRSLLSAVPEAFCRQIISGMFLVNVQKQRTKTHACVYCNRKRANYAAFILSAPIVYAILSAKIKPRYCLLPQHLGFSCIPQQILLRSAARKINLCQEISIIYCRFWRRCHDDPIRMHIGSKLPTLQERICHTGNSGYLHDFFTHTRNGYFHKDNIYSFEEIKAIREQAYCACFLLGSSFLFDMNKLKELI